MYVYYNKEQTTHFIFNFYPTQLSSQNSMWITAWKSLVFVQMADTFFNPKKILKDKAVIDL